MSSIILVICIIFLGLTACKEENKLIDKDKRMEDIQNNIQTVLKNNDLSKYTWNYDKYDDEFRADTSVKIGTDALIFISINVKSNSSNNDISTFDIYYENENCKKKDVFKNIDFKLFCSIINSISERTLSEDIITEFLENEKYNSEIYDKSVLINKRHNLDFMEDYILAYEYYASGYESLSFYGLCK